MIHGGRTEDHTLCTGFNQGLCHGQTQTTAATGDGEHAALQVELAESVGIAQLLLRWQLRLDVIGLVGDVVDVVRVVDALGAGV